MACRERVEEGEKGGEWKGELPQPSSFSTEWDTAGDLPSVIPLVGEKEGTHHYVPLFRENGEWFLLPPSTPG